jgi:phospholipid-transporting ATPase
MEYSPIKGSKNDNPGIIGTNQVGDFIDERNNTISVDNENLLLRGMKLKNTPSVIGVVVYTGRETKVQMNNAKASFKMSRLLVMTNFHIVFIFISQLIISSIASAVGTTWTINNQTNAWYLGLNDNDSTLAWHTKWPLLWLLNTGTWILIFTNFVPISLMVTLEIVKLGQAKFMEWESAMIDTE